MSWKRRFFAENRLRAPADLPVVRLGLDQTDASVRPGWVPGRVTGLTGGVAGLEHAESGPGSRKFDLIFDFQSICFSGRLRDFLELLSLRELNRDWSYDCDRTKIFKLRSQLNFSHSLT